MKPSNGMIIKITSDIENGSGLGDLQHWMLGSYPHHYMKYGEKIEANDLANYSYLIERMELGVVGGWQDFYGTIFSGYKFISFNNKDVKVQQLKIDNKIKRHLEKMIFFKFGKKRSSAKFKKERT